MVWFTTVFWEPKSRAHSVHVLLAMLLNLLCCLQRECWLLGFGGCSDCRVRYIVGIWSLYLYCNESKTKVSIIGHDGFLLFERVFKLEEMKFEPSLVSSWAGHLNTILRKQNPQQTNLKHTFVVLSTSFPLIACELGKTRWSLSPTWWKTAAWFKEKNMKCSLI